MLKTLTHKTCSFEMFPRRRDIRLYQSDAAVKLVPAHIFLCKGEKFALHFDASDQAVIYPAAQRQRGDAGARAGFKH